MIAAAIFGIFVIPLLFITAERLRGWRKTQAIASRLRLLDCSICGYPQTMMRAAML